MKVESITECSPWSILHYFRPAFSDNWPENQFSVFLRVAVLHRFYYTFILNVKKNPTEPVSSKRHMLASAPIEDSNKPALMRSLIRVFDVRSMCSQGSNVS